MLVAPADARRIIARHYPGMKFRILSKSATVGVRPTVDVLVGLPTLVWIRVAPGADSAVRIGRILPDLTTDWNWKE